MKYQRLWDAVPEADDFIVVRTKDFVVQHIGFAVIALGGVGPRYRFVANDDVRIMADRFDQAVFEALKGYQDHILIRNTATGVWVSEVVVFVDKNTAIGYAMGNKTNLVFDLYAKKTILTGV